MEKFYADLSTEKLNEMKDEYTNRLYPGKSLGRDVKTLFQLLCLLSLVVAGINIFIIGIEMINGTVLAVSGIVVYGMYRQEQTEKYIREQIEIITSELERR